MDIVSSKNEWASCQTDRVFLRKGLRVIFTLFSLSILTSAEYIYDCKGRDNSSFSISTQDGWSVEK